MPLDWSVDAACVVAVRDGRAHPDDWFPEDRTETGAADICALCPVLIECGQYAKDNDIEFGIWGGKTATERNGSRPRPKRMGGPRGARDIPRGEHLRPDLLPSISQYQRGCRCEDCTRLTREDRRKYGRKATRRYRDKKAVLAPPEPETADMFCGRHRNWSVLDPY